MAKLIGIAAFGGPEVAIDIAVMKDQVMDELGVSELPVPRPMDKDLASLYEVPKNWRAIINRTIPFVNARVTVSSTAHYRDQYETVIIRHVDVEERTIQGLASNLMVDVYHGETLRRLLNALNIDPKYIREVYAVASWPKGETTPGGKRIMQRYHCRLQRRRVPSVTQVADLTDF